MEQLQLFQIDAFTDTPFHGNPAAVCLLTHPLDDETLQAIATEMNLSETAFLRRTSDTPWNANDEFSLRWFTPKTEVTLCGHATLAAAALLFSTIGVKATGVTFNTLSGPLRARKTDHGVALDFPLDPPLPCEIPDDVLDAIRIPFESVVNAAYGERTRKLLLQLKNATLVSRLAPDFHALLAAVSMRDYRGLIVTAEGPAPYDFVSRYFAPWVGMNEDPVTGSSHTVLTPYWAERLGRGIPGTPRMHAYQASARGGELWVKLLGNHRVEITGQATMVLEGKLV